MAIICQFIFWSNPGVGYSWSIIKSYQIIAQVDHILPLWQPCVGWMATMPTRNLLGKDPRGPRLTRYQFAGLDVVLVLLVPCQKGIWSEFLQPCSINFGDQIPSFISGFSGEWNRFKIPNTSKIYAAWFPLFGAFGSSSGQECYHLFWRYPVQLLDPFFEDRRVGCWVAKKNSPGTVASMIFWLVVWNINFIFPYIGNNHPNWLSYFSKGVETTNQFCWMGISIFFGRWIKVHLATCSRSWSLTTWDGT